MDRDPPGSTLRYKVLIFSSYETLRGEDLTQSRLNPIKEAITGVVPKCTAYLVSDKYDYQPSLDEIFTQADRADVIVTIFFSDTDNRLATVEMLVPVFRNPYNIRKLIICQHPRVPLHELIKKWVQDHADEIDRVPFDSLETLCMWLPFAVAEKIRGFL